MNAPNTCISTDCGKPQHCAESEEHACIGLCCQHRDEYINYLWEMEDGDFKNPVDFEVWDASRRNP